MFCQYCIITKLSDRKVTAMMMMYTYCRQRRRSRSTHKVALQSTTTSLLIAATSSPSMCYRTSWWRLTLWRLCPTLSRFHFLSFFIVSLLPAFHSQVHSGFDQTRASYTSRSVSVIHSRAMKTLHCFIYAIAALRACNSITRNIAQSAESTKRCPMIHAMIYWVSRPT